MQLFALAYKITKVLKGRNYVIQLCMPQGFAFLQVSLQNQNLIYKIMLSTNLVSICVPVWHTFFLFMVFFSYPYEAILVLNPVFMSAFQLLENKMTEKYLGLSNNAFALCCKGKNRHLEHLEMILITLGKGSNLNVFLIYLLELEDNEVRKEKLSCSQTDFYYLICLIPKCRCLGKNKNGNGKWQK